MEILENYFSNCVFISTYAEHIVPISVKRLMGRMKEIIQPITMQRSGTVGTSYPCARQSKLEGRCHKVL